MEITVKEKSLFIQPQKYIKTKEPETFLNHKINSYPKDLAGVEKWQVFEVEKEEILKWHVSFVV